MGMDCAWRGHGADVGAAIAAGGSPAAAPAYGHPMIGPCRGAAQRKQGAGAAAPAGVVGAEPRQ